MTRTREIFENGILVNAEILSDRPKPTVISYNDFQGRFTEDEQTAILKFLDTASIINDQKWKLKAALERAKRNGVYLRGDPNTVKVAKTEAFMQALVDGGAITAAKRDTVMTP